jgi:glycosyltransferase involved in cell wall biosynthesis
MAADEPSVSVVIPSRRGGASLSRAVRTVLAQAHEGSIEAVVVFDGCDPTPLAVDDLVGDARTIVVRTNGGTRGPSGARNAGIDAASGSVVGFLDDDDAWLAGKVGRQLDRMRTTSSGASTCGVRYVADARYRDETIRVRPDMQRGVVADGIFVPLQTLLVDRSVLDEAGRFDEDLWVSEDTDLVLRLAGVTSFCAVDDALVVMERGHEDRLSLDYERHVMGFRRLAAKHHELFDRWPAGRARRYWRLAGLALRTGRRADARAWARLAVRLAPTSPKNLGMLAAAYLSPEALFDRAFGAYQMIGWTAIDAAVDVGPTVS